MPSGYSEVNLPEMTTIVECDNVDELRNKLEQDETSETAVRNFVILSPRLASSMAGIGTDGSRLEILFGIIQELKDLKFVGTRTTRSMNGMSTLIEEVLKFLSILAKAEINPRNKLPAALEFDKSQQNELKLYLNEVKTLLQHTNKNEQNAKQNDNIQDMEEDDEESEDELQDTKKRP